MKKIAIILIVSFVAFSGCYRDKLEDLNPAGDLFNPCDTTPTPTYSQHIHYILQNYCFSCHSGSSCSSGYPFDTYDQLKAQFDLGTLDGSLHHLHNFNPMPPSYTLDSCHLGQFERWMANGCPNN